MSRRLRTFVFCACLLLIGKPADAKWWTWLDELSGPGPYDTSVVWSAEVRCLARASRDDVEKVLDDLNAISSNPALSPDQKRERSRNAANQLRNMPCGVDRSRTVVSLVLEFGFWDDQPKRYIGDTRLRSYQAIAFFPLHRALGPSVQPNILTRSIEIGVGVGAYRLHGGTVREQDLWRGSVPLRSRIIISELVPAVSKLSNRWRKALQTVQLAFGADLLPGRLRSESFNGLNVDEEWDFVPSRSVQVDLGALVRALKKNP